MTDEDDASGGGNRLSRRTLLETLTVTAAVGSVAGCGEVGFGGGEGNGDRVDVETVQDGSGTARSGGTGDGGGTGYGFGGFGLDGYGGAVAATETATPSPATPSPTGPTGETVVSGDIDAATTWGDDEAVVVIESFVDIEDGAVVTVLPGTTVRVEQDHRIRIREGSALDAQGTAAQPITFEGTTRTPGFWDGLEFRSAHPKNRLVNVDISHGGGDGWANVWIAKGADVAIRDSMLRESASFGLVAERSRNDPRLDRLSGNSYEANGAAPVRIPPALVESMDAASTYAGGNDRDRIEVTTSGSTADNITETARWQALDVPVWFDGSAPVVLEADVVVMPGARFRFDQGGRLRVQTEGSLNAVGEENRPITFLGADETAGYWQGVEFLSDADVNRLENVEVAHGGADGWANVFIQAGAKAAVVDSLIRDSATFGIVVEGDGELVESGNTFEDNANGDIDQP